MSEQRATVLHNPYELVIDGDERPAASDETMAVYDPATDFALTEVAVATEDDVSAAVDAAADALEEWRRTPGKERARILHRFADAIREDSERLARIESLENGKPLSAARGQVRRCARHFEYYGGIADKLQGESIPLDESHVDYTIREPLGVTGHIVPWNVPIYLFGRSVAPAMAAGNTAVVKPAEETPLGAVELGRLAREVGLPDGVLNVVPGTGTEAGAALSGHPAVDSVTFTGSGPVGTEVAKNAAEHVSTVHLELGGKSPNVVFPDANLDHAVAETMKGIFTNAGQVCSAGSRLLVHEAVHDEFVDELAARTAELTLGPGVDDPDIGPLVSAHHHESVVEYLDVGREEVGEPVVGGGVPDRAGNFVEPTVFDGVTNDMRIAREEIFGPVLSVIEFADEAEAYEIANDSPYGLVAGVFTENVGRAHRFAREVDAGQIYVNEWFAGGNETPFGGFKASGVGRENGVQAVDNYTQIKNVCLNVARR
ncbi:aldehyde dehydrogenase family protein [Haloarchaeobius sp. DFWS5]|uniref:aldehyde dehydrogenase family protein n=1 Tax=Haloarchaeobius sp. DFWS5 TaxID=3446114 RepID=UPI003EBDF1C1